MKEVSMIINAGWVVPIIPENTVYEKYSVIVDGKTILDCLPTSEVASKYTSANVVERPNHVVMPGLINMHTHAAMSLFKGFSDDKSLMDWLQKDIWPAEGKFVGPEFVIDGTKLACAEMIRSGTTCYNDMYFAVDEAVETTTSIGIRATHGPGVFGFPTSWAPGPAECLEKNRRFLEKHTKLDNDLARYSVCPHAPYTVPEAYLIETKALCREFHVPMHIHVQETKAELEDSINGTPSSSRHLSEARCSPIENLAAHDLLDHTICAHCVHVTDHDIELLGSHHASVVHNPTSNLKLASGVCPVQRMLDHGVNVCLGTDSACSNNNLDMFSEMRNAALVGKVAAMDPRACSAPTVLRMATANAAKALGLEGKLGVVAEGALADLIAVDLQRVETWPLANVISHLVYACGRDQVTDVWVNGKQLMKERELLTLDMTELKRIAEKWDRILKEFRANQQSFVC